jgi:hypothetical protein
MGAVQLAGQDGERALGLDRGGGVVGLAHPLLHDRAQLLRQPVPDVADLVDVMPTSA